MTQPEGNDPSALLAAIIASSDDAIVSKDLTGRVTSWNQAAERMFGYSAAEMVGEHITRIIPIERHTEEDYVLSRIRAGLSVDHFETVRQRRDGTLIDVSLSVSPIRNRTGRVTGASKIARDITEQKRLRVEAAEASRAKDEFLAILSHELRTPLNAVLGYAHMLRNGAVPAPDIARALEAIGRNADAVARLLNDVFDTSRMVTGKTSLNLQSSDIGTVVEEASTAIVPAVRAKSIHIETRIEPGLVLTVDPDRIRQVVWNLLSNAVKFTDTGGTVTISAKRVDGTIRVSVADTGVGIPPEALPHLFRRFWQGDRSDTRVHGGLGLGLALARDFVELHGGRLEARSEGLGHGARFDIVLPARPDPVNS